MTPLAIDYLALRITVKMVNDYQGELEGIDINDIRETISQEIQAADKVISAPHPPVLRPTEPIIFRDGATKHETRAP